MTKTFEEELMTNEKIIEMINKLPNEGNKFELINSFCDALKEVFKNYHSDEEFQLLLRDRDTLKQGNDNLFKDHLELVKENKELKSQLEQQPLPVVPEDVAEFIERYKDRRTIYGVFDKISKNRKTYPKLYEWVFEYENSQATFAIAFITGKYEVEKPQLFYLREKNTNYYLNKSRNNGLELVVNPYFDEDNEFTQEEIDSMQTGSYEQIKVEEEK